ncbi:MAG: CoA transferase [Chloroflexi bacterium]|nr:CoA transferase [Chloroflexota bacterium]
MTPASLSSQAARPLDGVTILDFTRVYSGPYATLLLADMGARVIKVEHPQHGDDSRSFGPLVAGTSGYFETLNRGKQSIAVDYRHPDGQKLLRSLATQVDVVIENFRPGQMAAYGLDYDRLAADSPRLIYVSLSGYGQTGPNAALKCYDVVAQAASGLMSLTGLTDLPIKTGPAIADAIAGLTAAVGLLGALWGRERTGRGRYVDVAMVESVFAVLENALAQYSVTGQIPERSANQDAVIAPFDCFATRDGWVALGVGNDRLWRAFAAQIADGLADDPRFRSNADRVAHYAALRPLIADWCASQPAEGLTARLQAAGIPCGALRSIDELAHDPALEARGMLAHLALADGTDLLVPGSPIHFRDTAPPVYRRAPALGEHSRVLLEQFGWPADQVEALMHSGVVGA